MDRNKQPQRSENVRGRSRDEQQNQPGSELEDRLTNRRSSVASASESFLDYQFGTSAQTSNSDSESPALMDGIRNTEGIRTYDGSKHTEFTHSKFTGRVRFGPTINYKVGPGVQETLEKFAESHCAHDAAFNSRRAEHESMCLEDTRVGLLQDIGRWSNDPGDACIFWLNGMAGTGKSTIARTVARTWDNEKRLGASFFFSRGKGDLARAAKFFTTLAYQLASTQSDLTAGIRSAICNHPDISRKSLQEQWKHLILQPLSRLNGSPSEPPSLVLVLDALDECDDEEDTELILKLLSQAKTLSSMRLLIFITSRPETPIRHGFHYMPDDVHRDFVLHQISDSVVGRDISVFLLHEFDLIRTRRHLPREWPAESSLTRLVEKANGLFIYAATVCRFVGYRHSSPQKRLDLVLQDSTENGSPTEKLDSIYTTILQNTVGDREDSLQRFRRVVGPIVILFDALTAAALAELLGAEQWEVEETLESLCSVLDYSQEIRLIHPSFRDFLLDDQRCNDPKFRIIGKDAHRELAVSCLKLLSNCLKTNMCSLKLPGILTSEVDGYALRRCLSREAEYACRYWVDHLQRSNTTLRGDNRSHGRVHTFLQEHFWYGINDRRSIVRCLSTDEQLHNQVHTFLKEHLLHWLEALGLMANISEGVVCLKNFEAMLTSDSDPSLRRLAHDTLRFILNFRSILEIAPLQIYCSALTFSPKRSILRNQFRNDIPNWIQSQPEIHGDWDSTLHVLVDHSDSVCGVSFSPDGKLLASASLDNTVRLWDPTTGACRAILGGHSSSVTAVAFSPDGKILASASWDQTVRLWDPTTGACRAILEGHSGSVWAVAFSPGGKILTSASGDTTIQLWDPTTGACGATLKGHSDWVRGLAFSPDGKLLASASFDKTVRLWDPPTGACRATLEDHSNGVTAVAFSPNGKILAFASGDKTIRLWDPATVKSRATLKGHSKWVRGVAFSPDGKLLASASGDKTVRLWDPRTGTCRATLKGHTSAVKAVVFSPDGMLLASASYDNTIRLWDPPNGTFRSSRTSQSDCLRAVVFSPDGKFLASTSISNTIRLWDPLKGTCRATLKGHSDCVLAVTFSPDGRLLASASDDRTVRVWDPTKGTSRATLEGHSGSVRAVAFSPDGKLLASASNDQTVRLWDPTAGTSAATLMGCRKFVRVVAYSPDRQSFASASDGKVVRLGDPKSGACCATLEGHSSCVTAVSFSPDGKLLASASLDKTVRLWELMAGTSRATLEGHSGSVRAVAFSPNGKLLTSASNDKTVRLWDSTTGVCRATLKGHSDEVWAVAFSPDCKLVISTSDDWTTHFFNVDAVSPTSEEIYPVDMESKSPTSSPPPLYVNGHWVCSGTRKILFVPPDYRTNGFAIRNNVIALTHRSGTVHFIQFDLDSVSLV